MSAAIPKRKPTSIGKALAHLQRPPIPYLKPTVKSLELRLAPKNGHWGARHFLKADLPRIAHANPNITYRVDKSRKLTIEKSWAPLLRLEFVDGTKHDVEADGKLSSEIMNEVIRIAGGQPPAPQPTTEEA